MKILLCSINLLDLHDIKAVMEQISSESDSEAHVKDKAVKAVRLIEEMAASRSVSLKLRKNPK